MQPKSNHAVGVMITGTNSINNLGVIRGLGRHGVPIILLDVDRGSMVRYSKYVSKKLTCPDPNKSEIQFINFLLDFGKQMDKKCMIIPTGDMDALILSKHKDKLERFYILPMPSFEVIQKLVDKKRFYKLLDQMSIPHPKTYFTEDISELKFIGQEIDYPYIIKPAYSHLFSKKFGAKNFVINSSQELNRAIEKLRDKNMEVMIQEIIQGKKIYMFYAYFNKQSEPIAICGYDKLRQYSPDFGSGSLCKSAWRSIPIDSAIQVLKAIKYHGMAEPGQPDVV
jgi:predicted ATP-grasp superfamily ATP-dependent carboligase